MLWVDIEKGVQMTRLSPSGKKLGAVDLGFGKQFCDLDYIEGGFIVAAFDHRDLEGKPSNYRPPLKLEAYSYAGQKMWETTLIDAIYIRKGGDRGYEYDRGICEVDNLGEYIVVYYPVNMKSDKDGLTHQGDAYQVIDFAGNILPSPQGRWHASHSFDQRTVKMDGGFGLFALGDGYPHRGVNFNFVDMGKKQSGGAVDLYHFAGEIGDNYVGDTQFGNVISDGERAFLIISTEERVRGKTSGKNKRENDLILLCTDKNGQKLFERNLTNTPGIDELSPQIHFMGDQIMVSWKLSDYYYDMPVPYSD
jgi:hypothetical protein